MEMAYPLDLIMIGNAITIKEEFSIGCYLMMPNAMVFSCLYLMPAPIDSFTDANQNSAPFQKYALS